MNKVSFIILSAAISCALTLLVVFLFFGKNHDAALKSIPQSDWPTFDKMAPYTINGPLWVGFDNQEGEWKYIKVKYSQKPTNAQRGILDPGSPDTWSSKHGIIGYFNGDLSSLPSGTHLNNRYNPSTLSCKYKLDDIMIKVGNFWIDKYEASVAYVQEDEKVKWMDDPEYGGFDKSKKDKVGTGYTTPVSAIAVSQQRQGSTGFTYFVAEQCAINNGKHIARNEQWQAAAGGTMRTNAEGMKSGGESWELVEDQDLSRFGVVGCAGSLWEWTSSWGQYGEHYDGVPTNWYDWPGPQSHVEWDDRFDTYGNDIIINVAGRSYTRQDSARYAMGLPAALVRGGCWGDRNRAGIFAIIADGAPSYYGYEVGFRCIK